MLADTVEPHCLYQFHISAEMRICRGRQAALGPIPLIENEDQRIGSAVEDEPVSLHAQRALRGIAHHAIEHFACSRAKPKLGANQTWAVRAPQQLIAIIVNARV